MIQDKSAINRMLKSHGLPPLEAGHGLMVFLGAKVQDHEHLRSLLARCEPENRPAMYDALVPHLNFTAKPLDVYISESARRAEREGLPTIDDAGNLTWKKNDPSQADILAAQRGIDELFAKHHLRVTCRSCTKQEVFTGDTKHDAVLNARLAGWVYYEVDGVPREICPDCPAIRKVN